MGQWIWTGNLLTSLLIGVHSDQDPSVFVEHKLFWQSQGETYMSLKFYTRYMHSAMATLGIGCQLV